MMWKIANNGSGRRIWFVVRGPGNHTNEYAEDACGNLRRFGSADAAQNVADALNGGAA